MAKQTSLSSDFADFLRDLGLRSLDHLATSISSDETTGRTSASGPIAGVADKWLGLNPDDKALFIDRLISAATIVVAAAPAAAAVIATVKRERKGSATKSSKKSAAGAKGSKSSANAKSETATKSSKAPKKKPATGAKKKAE